MITQNLGPATRVVISKFLCFGKLYNPKSFLMTTPMKLGFQLVHFFFRVTTKKRFDIWEHHHMDTGSKLLLYRVGPQIDLSPQV